MKKSTRESFGEELVNLGTEFPNIYVLDADLKSATKTQKFSEKFSDRFFDMGISEQDMIGFAAGLSHNKRKVVAASFSTFISGRAYDFVRQSICYSNMDVLLVGSHSGLSVGKDGATHQMLEDIALMRALANMQVFTASDDVSTKAILRKIIGLDGPKYFRLYRNEVESIYSPEDFNEDVLNSGIYEFKIQNTNKFNQSQKILLISMGDMTRNSLDAKKMLEELGYSVMLIDIFKLHPLTNEAKVIIIRDILSSDYTFTIEDHSIYGGLFSIICENYFKCKQNFNYVKDKTNLLNSVKIIPIGMSTFGKSDSAEKLYDYFNLSSEKICKKILETIRMENKLL